MSSLVQSVDLSLPDLVQQGNLQDTGRKIRCHGPSSASRGSDRPEKWCGVVVPARRPAQMNSSPSSGTARVKGLWAGAGDIVHGVRNERLSSGRIGTERGRHESQETPDPNEEGPFAKCQQVAIVCMSVVLCCRTREARVELPTDEENSHSVART